MCPSRSLRRFALMLAVSLALGQAAFGADDVDRRQLYAKAVKGCVGVITAGGPASGWVVDLQKRWIVTCQHVVGTRSEVDIVSPSFKDGRPVQERSYYINIAPRHKAKVLSSDAHRDLCLLQVDSLPPGTVALNLVKESGQPGDNLHLIGNPASSGAMWNYTSGTLRAVYHKTFTYKFSIHEVDAVVGETQLPANPGDSGAAVLSDKGEVLGVHSGGSPDNVQLMATYIDAVEVRAFLSEPFKVVTKLMSFDEFFVAANDYLMGNEVDRAIEAYSQAIKLKPDHSEVWRCRASAYIRKKSYDKALDDCNQALLLNRANARAYNERAVCHGAKGDHQAALVDYNEAIRIKSNDAMFWAGRAWTYNALKESGKAIDDATEAIRLKSDFALPYAERGLAEYRLKVYEKAMADLDRALKYQPNKVEALHYRGLTLVAQKKQTDAIKAFTDVIRINPKFGPAYKERGTIYYNQLDYQLALKDYNDAIAINAKDDQAWLWRSWCHKKLGNQQQAAADLREAIHLNPALALATDDSGS